MSPLASPRPQRGDGGPGLLTAEAPRVGCGGAVNEGLIHVTPKGLGEKSREEMGSFTGATDKHAPRRKTRPLFSSKHPPEL